MRTIEVEEDIYAYLCSHTREFGEAPSSILRRLLRLPKPGLPQETPEESTPIGDHTPVGSREDEDRVTVGAEGEPPGPGRDELQQQPNPASELAQFLTTRAFAGHHQALGRFLAILAWLYQRHGQEFEAVTRVRGRNRIYFAENPDDIARTGRSTKPQLVPGTPWHVATNTSTRLKVVILTKILSHLRYSKGDIELVGSVLDSRRSRGARY